MNIKLPDEVKPAHQFILSNPRYINVNNVEYFNNEIIKTESVDHLLQFTDRFDKNKINNSEYKLRTTEYDGQNINIIMLDCNEVEDRDDKIKVELLIANINIIL